MDKISSSDLKKLVIGGATVSKSVSAKPKAVPRSGDPDLLAIKKSLGDLSQVLVSSGTASAALGQLSERHLEQIAESVERLAAKSAEKSVYEFEITRGSSNLIQKVIARPVKAGR